MRNYLLGVFSGLAIYHFTFGGSNQELITEMRGWVKSIDDRLAEAEKSTPPTVTDPPVEYRNKSGSEKPPTPPPSPPRAA